MINRSVPNGSQQVPAAIDSTRQNLNQLEDDVAATMAAHNASAGSHTGTINLHNTAAAAHGSAVTRIQALEGEVGQARGAKGSLTTRLNVAMDALGNLKLPVADPAVQQAIYETSFGYDIIIGLGRQWAALVRQESFMQGLNARCLAAGI